MELRNLRTEEEICTATRSLLYQIFSKSFTVPGQEFYDSVKEGEFIDNIISLSEALPYPFPSAEVIEGLKHPGSDYQDFESEYIRLFDVGIMAPPCPLYEGVYGEHTGRKKIMEELIRFYNHFDLSMSKENRELPDHITAELEFMHFLSFKEAQALNHNLDRQPYVRAQKDFLNRHLAKWVPKLWLRLKQVGGLEFFEKLVLMLKEFVEADREYLLQLVEDL